MALQEPQPSSEDALSTMGGGDDPAVQAARLEALSRATPAVPKEGLSEDAIAAALESAGRKDVPEEDALAAMASGQLIGDEAPQIGPPPLPTGERDDSQGDIPPAQDAAPSGEGNFAQPMSRAGVSRLAARNRQVHAHGFKEIAIPGLMVMGGLLLVMGTTVVILQSMGYLSATSAQSNDFVSNLLNAHRGILLLIAFPLGAILLLSAWLFHREISETKKQ